MVKKKLKSSDCHFLIMEDDNNHIGSIRFDIAQTNFALISYLIAPEFQGKGFGEIILKSGINDLLSNKPQIKYLKGKIFKENIASVRIFEKLGFNLEGNDDYSATYLKEI